MTREEAINILNDYDINFERNTAEEVAEAHEMAIEALEKQPSENELSENEKIAEAFDMAIKAIKTIPSEDEKIIRIKKGTLKARTGRFVIYDVDWLRHNFNTTEAKIYGQPSEDCISRKAVLDGLASIAKAKAKSDVQKSLMGRVMFFTEHLPSVTPQPEKHTEERAETHECDLEQIIKSTIKEYLDKECDDVIELLLTLSKDLCERIKHEDEKATAAHSNAENKPRLSKPAFTVIDHVLKEHEEHEDRFTTFCDGRHQQITVKQINAELDKLYNYFYGKGEESGEGTK